MIDICSTFENAARAGSQTERQPGRPGLNPLRFSEKYTITEKHAQDLAEIAEVTGINGLRDLHRQEGFIAPLPEGVMEFGGKMFEISKDGTEGRSSSPNPIDVKRTVDAIREAKMTCEAVLVMVHSHEIRKKIKKNTSVTWWGMAVQNVFRNWKKGLIVMLSIALSMVVVNCIVILVQGYDFDSYRKVVLASDFQLDQMTDTLSNTNFNGITPEIKEILNKCPESEKTGYVYYSEERHKMEPALLKTWETLAEKNKENWTDYEKQIWEETKADNTVKVHFLGISEAVFDMLEWKGEKCSWDTFKSGDYVIVDYSDKYTEQPVSYYQSGETFKMEYGNGKQKDYGVIGEAMMPYSLDYPYADSVYITVMVPEEEYITQTENQSAMYATIDAKKGEDKQVKEYIDKNVLKENDMINVFSVLDMKASFRRFVSKYYMIGSFLVVILAFIGIMNFFNTTATSVISRKKELALLEVVGMTKKQISKMLVAEGFLYLGGAFVIAVLLIVFGAKQILVNTLGTAFFFRLHLTIVPCVFMIPILVGIAYVIPKYQFEKMSRESIVERIRKE